MSAVESGLPGGPGGCGNGAAVHVRLCSDTALGGRGLSRPALDVSGNGDVATAHAAFAGDAAFSFPASAPLPSTRPAPDPGVTASTSAALATGTAVATSLA